jgi:hypothetical protein
VVTLTAQIDAVPGAPEMRDGWRGLLDFGELWTEMDADFWPADSGDLPLGQPLVYGCEVLRDSAIKNGATIRLPFVDQPRPVMQAGATLTLREGHATLATGRLV